MTTAGVSALLLQRQLGLSRYETAWMMLHKLRRAIDENAASPSAVEVVLAARKEQLKGRRAALVMVAVEKRVRMSVIPDFKKVTIEVSCPERCSRLDHLHRRSGAEEAGYKHVSRPQPPGLTAEPSRWCRRIVDWQPAAMADRNVVSRAQPGLPR